MNITFDTNRLGAYTPRIFASCWRERAGSRVYVLPTVAAELTNGRSELHGAALSAWKTQARQSAPSAFHATGRRAGERPDLWWIEEFETRGGPFERVRLSETERVRADELFDAIPDECFPGLSKDPATTLRDKAIVCEAATKRMHVLITTNLHSIDDLATNRWFAEQERESGRKRPMRLLWTPDDALTALYANPRRRGELVKTALAAALERCPSEDLEAVDEQLARYLDRFEMRGTQRVVELIRATWTNTREPRRWIREVLSDPPRAAWTAERRHPLRDQSARQQR